jgi:predicted ArsR family transcriptional regulator
VLIAAYRVSDGADGSNPGPQAQAGTRDRVQRVICEYGPLTATALASRLGLTPAAVRRHLDRLAEQGTIEERVPVTAGGGRGRGRPGRAYSLSEAAHAGMDSDYGDVATSALRFLAEHAGTDAVGEFARERIAGPEQRYAAQLAEAGQDITVRAQALARALSADGFAASARPVEPGTPLAGVQLLQRHCPVQHVADQFPAFCDVETAAFSRLLGVHVQRLGTLAHGEHVCTTLIPGGAVPLAALADATPSDERSSR